MKNLALIISLFMLSYSGFSQKKTGESDSPVFSKSKLSLVKFIRELAADLPKESQIVSIDMVGTGDGKIMAAAVKGDELNEEGKNLLKKADPGTKIYIDIKYIEPKIHNRNSSLAFAITVI